MTTALIVILQVIAAGMCLYLGFRFGADVAIHTAAAAQRNGIQIKPRPSVFVSREAAELITKAVREKSETRYRLV